MFYVEIFLGYQPTFFVSVMGAQSQQTQLEVVEI